MSIFSQGEVEDSEDFQRIKRLPRRRWEEWCEAQNYVEIMTARFRKPGSGSTDKLRPVQAASLVEAYKVGGLFGPQRVGAGKTLTSLLCALVMNARTPVLLLPAMLLEKTRRDMADLSTRWLIPATIKMMSYESLGRKEHKNDLDEYHPDLIIADEAHRLKSSTAGVTKRVKRYMGMYPDTKFVALSGTILRKSLDEYVHLMHWCLKRGAPIPFDLKARQQWQGCLDPKHIDASLANSPGVLKQLCNTAELDVFRSDPMKAVRTAFRRRVNETPGVVATEEGAMSMSLLIDSRVVIMPEKAMKAAIFELKEYRVRPDGIDVLDGLELQRHLREMACGFYYRWNPAPPLSWREARSKWAQFVKKFLKNNPQFETAGEVVDQILKGHVVCPEYSAWMVEREKPQADGKKFEIVNEAVFISDAVIDACIQWINEEKSNPGIVWSEHSAFARRLAKKAGIPYYGREGLDANDVYIENHLSVYPGMSLVASRPANGTGKNLQKMFNRGLMPVSPQSASDWEQTLGRTHRDGQPEDEVRNTLLITMQEQIQWLNSTRAQARNISDTVGQEQKLCYATFAMVAEEDAPTGM